MSGPLFLLYSSGTVAIMVSLLGLSALSVTYPRHPCLFGPATGAAAIPGPIYSAPACLMESGRPGSPSRGFPAPPLGTRRALGSRASAMETPVELQEHE